MLDVFSIYERLWHRAEAEGAYVDYDGADWHGMAGYFDPRLEGDFGPAIWITRPYYRDSPPPHRESNAPIPYAQPDLEDELITLAHEYGHFRSFSGRTPRDEWDRYNEVAHRRSRLTDEIDENMPDGLSAQECDARSRESMLEGLDDEARARIIREEQTAWDVGREVLTELGFTAWAAFDDRERKGMHNHRYRLGMEEAWPDDL